jgi:hypothetical protein
VADEMAAAHPLLRYRVQGGSAALFDGEPPRTCRPWASACGPAWSTCSWR